MCAFVYENAHDNLPTFHTQVEVVDQDELYRGILHPKPLINLYFNDLSSELAFSSSNNKHKDKQTNLSKHL